MRIIDGLLAELEQEATTTRRVLERIPQEHLSWRPHPKSMSLGQLALHVATVPGMVAEIAAIDTVTTPNSFIQPEAATAAELVPALAESVAKAKRAWKALGAAENDFATDYFEGRHRINGPAAYEFLATHLGMKK